MDIKKYTSTKIREYRKLNGLTQKELGDKIGVKHNTISGYENGTSEPEQDLLFKIANVLHISINDLFPSTTSETCPINILISNITYEESEIIKKYRALDDRGKENVIATLDREYEHSKENEEPPSENKVG